MAAVRRAPRGAVSALCNSAGASTSDQSSSAVVIAATTWMTVIGRRPVAGDTGSVSRRRGAGGSPSGMAVVRTVCAGFGSTGALGPRGAPADGSDGRPAGPRGTGGRARCVDGRPGAEVGALRATGALVVPAGAGACGGASGAGTGVGSGGAAGAVAGRPTGLVTVAVRPVAVAVDPPAWPTGDDRNRVGVLTGAPGSVDHGPAGA